MKCYSCGLETEQILIKGGFKYYICDNCLYEHVVLNKKAAELAEKQLKDIIHNNKSAYGR
jgi:hypothetical protein